MSTITLSEVKAAQDTFLLCHWPPMSTQWTALKDAAVGAIKQYARENGLTVNAVIAMIEAEGMKNA